MLRIIPTGLAGVLVCSLALTSWGREPDLAPVPRRVLNQDEYVPHSFMGRVIAVTDDTVTLKPEGYIQITEQRSLGDGRYEFVSLYRQDNTKPPRTFTFNDELHFHNGTLPAGRRAKGVAVSSANGQHKIADIRIGDLVSIGCRTLKGVNYCTSLEILRRAGGRVPPAIGDEKLPVEKQVATWRNAEQQREEKAVQVLSRVFRPFRP